MELFQNSAETVGIDNLDYELDGKRQFKGIKLKAFKNF